jgi:hypothetical protein
MALETLHTLVRDIQTVVGQSPAYLYERDTMLHEMDAMHEILMQGAHVWYRENADRHLPSSGLLRTEHDKNESFIAHVSDGIESLRQLDIAERAANGLRWYLQYDNRNPNEESEFGKKLFRATNNWRLSDHAHKHFRRDERWIEAMMINIGALRHTHDVSRWTDSIMLVPYWHDADQLLTLQRNLDNRGMEGWRDLNVKNGHGLAAAVMLLAMHKRYAVERAVTVEEAWRICAGAAYMIVKHDVPEQMFAALNGREKAYTLDEHGNHILVWGAGEERENSQHVSYQPLRDMFEHNRLDLTSISPSQLISLLRAYKGAEPGFISTLTPNGLDPAFEAEYIRELTALGLNDRPLLENFDERLRPSLELAAEVTVRGDTIEFTNPTFEAITRTLMTQYSMRRPWYEFSRFTELYQELKQRNAALGELHGDEILLYAIFYGPGNLPLAVDFDVRRLLWEFVHTEEFSSETTIARSQYMQKVTKENVIMGIIALREFGLTIMQGDLRVLDMIYENRVRALGIKAIRKMKLSRFRSRKLRSIVNRQDAREGAFCVYESVKNTGNKELMRAYVHEIQQVFRERRSLLNNFHQKPDATNGEIRIYSREEIRHFQKIVDMVTEEFARRYNASPKEMALYRKKVLRGEFPPETPYHTYDSLATGNFRTLLRKWNPAEDGDIKTK